MSIVAGHHIVHSYDEELGELHNRIEEMGNLVFDQLSLALRALAEKDSRLAQETVERERLVNRMEVDSDTEIFTILAKRCPVAGDLREVMAASKIVANLERVGDEAAKLANFVLYLHAHENVFPERVLSDIHAMGLIACETLRCALDALARRDVNMARAVESRHRTLDAEFQAALGRLMHGVESERRNIEYSVSAVLIMKALQRSGDHIQNIAELVVFEVEGERESMPDFSRDFPDLPRQNSPEPESGS